MALCPFNPASEDYADFIYNYSSQNVLSPTGPLLSGACTEFVTQNYAIFYVPLNSILPLSLEKYAYYSIPNLFTPLDTSSMDASGILSTFNTPALANKGAGTMIGFLDTGIDYANPTAPPEYWESGIRPCRWTRMNSPPACRTIFA